MLSRMTFSVLLLAAVSLPSAAVAGGDPTTISLTATVRPTADESERDRADALLALLEIGVANQPGLSLVERRQIDLALYELAMSEGVGQGSSARVQLGKIASADLILSMKLLDPNDAGRQQVFVRVTESLTGAVRGAILVDVEHATIEDAAEQLQRYLVATIEAPRLAGVTVSVAPFESQAAFGQIRPLELVIRDVITAQLLEAGHFQVLQRADLGPLLDELSLIQSALVDQDRLPETLPTRQGLYHLRGKINDRFDAGTRTILVDAELVHAVTDAVVLELDFETSQDELRNALAIQVTRVVAFLSEKAGASSDAPSAAETTEVKFDETRGLLEPAMRDAHRFIRRRTYDFAYRPFGVPDYDLPARLRRPTVETDSELGDQLLRATIDRLETIHFLHPERQDVSFVLAFCYSFHRPGTWEPERAESLLRTIFEGNPNSELGVAALELYGEMYVNHEGQLLVAPEHVPLAIEHLRFAIEHIPAEQAGRCCGEWLRTLTKLHERQDDLHGLLKTLHLVASVAERPEAVLPDEIGRTVMTGATSLVREAKDLPALQAEARDLIVRWSEHDLPRVRYWGCRAQGDLAVPADPVTAAEWYLRAASVAPDDPIEATTRAARCLLNAHQPESALKALLSVEAKNDHFEFDYGFYGLELGKCYEALGDSGKALETYLHFAEEARGLAYSGDVLERIHKLGGVPRRTDCDVDVRYVDLKEHPIEADNGYVAGAGFDRALARALASDGHRLYCANLGTLRQREPGVLVLDVETGAWSKLDGIPHIVRCLACEAGFLWAGTWDAGIWHCDLASGTWTHWTDKEGLPANSVVTLRTQGPSAFVSLGEVTPDGDVVSGGVAQITAEGEIHVLQGGDAPGVGPTSMALTDESLLAVSYHQLFEWKFAETTWSRRPEGHLIGVHRGETGVWASRSRREVFRLNATAEENSRFQRAWFPDDRPKATYLPQFFLERDGALWIGGRCWNEFKSSGLYKLDLVSGAFQIYGPRDGLRYGPSSNYECYDGVFVGDGLWLATSFGIVEVTPRSPTGDETTDR